MTAFSSPRIVSAILGPTNTGKTHLAIDRMLGRKSGVIGFPLRLLAREVYDRLVRARGPSQIALVTGEEKIVPATAKYYICTVEAMALDWGADFLAVDEIQLCADPERGHVFTDRLLNARGLQETMFLGSASMRDKIRALVPEAEIQQRERLSTLSWVGSKKLSRLPPRSAVVAFSAENVYAIAELLRRQKGGAAVVMGAMSPRTRNAQVEMFQSGEVDYLVATDAIGMGLNLDIHQIFFAGLEKFDGRRHRPLTVAELSQIAGRAGRHTNDGGFGVTGEARPIDPEMIREIEEHRVDPVRHIWWRNSRLELASPEALLKSLEAPPPAPGLMRVRDADDEGVLKILLRDSEIRDSTRGRSAVKLLWEVCQTPDFRKSGLNEHAALLERIYAFLSGGGGVIPTEWMAEQMGRLDRTDGDIDAISKRLAYIRTWTYAAHRPDWLADPAYWREATRALEDRLSDALHARLTQRFVDRRASLLMRRLKQKEELVASVDKDGSVAVEGEFVGRIEGLRFQPDKEAEGAQLKALLAASAAPVAAELTQRVEKLYAASDAEIDFTEQGGLVWDNVVVGRIVKGAEPLAPKVKVFADDLLEAVSRERAERRLQQWLDRRVATLFEPLNALKNDEAMTGLARGVAFQLSESLGVLPRAGEAAASVKSLDQEGRGQLRKHGVRFGQHTIFIPALLKPAAARLRLTLWGVFGELEEIPAPPPAGVVTFLAPESAPAAYYPMSGYRRSGARAIRIDMLERLADLIRTLDGRTGFEPSLEMLSITGLTMDQFVDLMSGLNYVAEKGERPKRKPEAAKAPASDAPPAEAAAPEAVDSPEAAAPEAPEEAPAPVEAVAETPAEPPVESPVEAAAESPAESPVEAAAPEEAEAAEAAPQAKAQSAREEIEVFYLLRYSPRARTERGPRREGAREGGPRRGPRQQAGAPAGAGGAPREGAPREAREGAPREGRPPRREGEGGRPQGERRPRGEGGDRPQREGAPPREGGRPPRREGEGGRPQGERFERRGGPRRPPEDRGPRAYVAAPPPAAGEKKGAPSDSPFAVLQRLKDQT
ncbi:helicase-related protein [Neomegalonema perideroedes]|uniref:helicase-related protein n=1 Tax=Neomegalonema perideroedes TaxID=217219 RepID=UPI00036F6351|nr:helicase-related protein [Neomegalonema perideroedes]